MAEPKKSSYKTKGSARQATAKPKAEVIDVATVEKPTAAESLPSHHTAATSQNQTSTDQPRRRSTMVASQSVTLVIAGVAFVVALLALALVPLVALALTFGGLGLGLRMSRRTSFSMGSSLA